MAERIASITIQGNKTIKIFVNTTDTVDSIKKHITKWCPGIEVLEVKLEPISIE